MSQSNHSISSVLEARKSQILKPQHKSEVCTIVDGIVPHPLIDMIRDGILICTQKLTSFNLIYRREPKTKKLKNYKCICLEVSVTVQWVHGVRREEEKEGYNGKDLQESFCWKDFLLSKPGTAVALLLNVDNGAVQDANMTFLMCKFYWLVLLMQMCMWDCMLPVAVKCLMLLLSPCIVIACMCVLAVFATLLYALRYLHYGGPYFDTI